jgi:hypothetical protein
MRNRNKLPKMGSLLSIIAHCQPVFTPPLPYKLARFGPPPSIEGKQNFYRKLQQKKRRAATT